MLLKYSLNYYFLSILILPVLCQDIYAQECPPLPKHGFQVEYHQRSIDLSNSHLLKGHQFIPHETKIDLQKEKELKSYFNRILWNVQEAKCIPNQVLDDKIFLFQTEELLKDSVFILTRIHNLHKYAPGIHKPPISSVYQGAYQRDVFLTGDSIRISIWYIRQFSSDEIKEITANRKKLAFLADSLNLEIAKQEENDLDWRTTDAQINTLRTQRIPLKAQTDSIDFILYPSHLRELKSWYEQQYERVLDPIYNPEIYLAPRGYMQKGVIIDSDTDPFLEKKFRLHHVFDNNPYFARTISMGDSSILQGQIIYNTKYLREDHSPWRDGHFSYWSLNEKYLIVLKQESNIGETFWDYKHTYYIYEAVE